MKKLPRLKWSTTVMPDEYDYIGQFSRMVKLANQNKQYFCEMDVGKVWGLVLAYKELSEKVQHNPDKYYDHGEDDTMSLMS